MLFGKPIYRLLLVAALGAIGCAPPPAEETAVADGLPPLPAEHEAGLAAYEANCATCHDISRDGAPRLGFKRAWAKRLNAGQDALVASVIEGKGMMPPKAENPDLTAQEIASAVGYMMYRAELDIPAKGN